MSYRTLDAAAIIQTLRRLESRIGERFPDSGLYAVCQDLVAIGEDVQQKSSAIAKPNLVLRAAICIAIAAGVAGLAVIPFAINFQMGSAELLSVFQGVEAAANIVVLMGAALFFLVSIETRIKRRRAMRDLHTFRSFAHVIDMHQLTKDPSAVVSVAGNTPSSPARTLSRFEVTRYLDYCSEMLSLTSKVAVLFAQGFPDPIVTETVSDIERIAAGLAQKIWQKIIILEALGPEKEGSRQ